MKLIRIYFNFNKLFKLYTNALDTELRTILAQNNKKEKEKVISNKK